MKTKGRLKSIDLSFKTKRAIVSFEVEADPADVEQYQDMALDIQFKKHRNRRSLDANAMLWACLGEMAAALKTDNWSMYLYELERYGKFTSVLIRPEAVADMKLQWRWTKVVGEQTVYDPVEKKDVTMIQMLCFFGSSTYDSKEFSRLLSGVIDDMKDIHLTPPPSSDMRRAIENLEKQEKAKKG